MLRTSLRLRWMGGLAALAVMVTLAACGTGSAMPAGLTPAGFLQIPTRTPAPVETVPYIHERSDLCPGYGRQVCIIPGDIVNLYDVLSLARAVALQVFDSNGIRWILDEDAQHVLRLLDADVVLESGKLPTRNIFALSIIWPEGQGIPVYDHSLDSMEMLIDLNANAIGTAIAESVQWPLPEGFVDLILASASDVTPTPQPQPTRQPPRPPPPTRTPLPTSSIFFDHPEDRLRWDGPDGNVYSLARGHCEAPTEIREAFGVPALIIIDDEIGFWFTRITSNVAGWNWTGYHHGEWQIWQGADPRSIYLLHSDDGQIAFEYRNFGCI